MRHTNNGPNLLLRISKTLLASRQGLRYLLLACISVYGLLVWLLDLLGDGPTRRISVISSQPGTVGTVLDCACAPLTRQTPDIARPPGWAPQPPRRWICLVPMTRKVPLSLEALESGLERPFGSPTLDTITCWELHND